MAIFNVALSSWVHSFTLGLTTGLLILNTAGQISRSPGVIKGQILKRQYLKNCAAQAFQFLFMIEASNHKHT
jgi:hypothetical protein